MKTFNELLPLLTVPCRDNGKVFTDTTRLDAIVRLLDGSAYETVYAGNLCRIYARRDTTGIGVLVSSHIDCVYGRCFARPDAEGWKGTFDNSATNALLVELMLQDALPYGTLIAFTGDEEADSGGAREVMDWMKEHDVRPEAAIVLDVTNEGYDDEAAFAIENDCGFDILSGYRIVTALQEAQVMCTVVHDAEPDESWCYAKGTEACPALPSLSLCLPASGELHGEEGICIRTAATEHYRQMLVRLAALFTQGGSN